MFFKKVQIDKQNWLLRGFKKKSMVSSCEFTVIYSSSHPRHDHVVSKKILVSTECCWRIFCHWSWHRRRGSFFYQEKEVLKSIFRNKTLSSSVKMNMLVMQCVSRVKVRTYIFLLPDWNSNIESIVTAAV